MREHRWQLFVDRADGKTLDFIDKLVVSLHPSFPNPRVTLDKVCGFCLRHAAR